MTDQAGEDNGQDVALGPSPGARLRHARESQKKTIVDVASSLNVRPQLIEAIEDDDLSAFPAQVYARGLIRNYARLLGLDSEPLLLLYEELAGSVAPPLDSVNKIDHASPVAGRGPLLLPFIAVAILVLLAAYAIYHFAAEPRPMVPAAIIPDESPSAEPQVTSRTPVTPPSETRPATAAVLAENARDKPSPDEPDASTKAVQVAPEDELLLVFDADSWVEVRDGDGRRLLSRTGKAGQQMRLKGPAPFDVRLGYAPGVRIEYNGRPYKSPVVGKSRVAHLKIGPSSP